MSGPKYTALWYATSDNSGWDEFEEPYSGTACDTVEISEGIWGCPDRFGFGIYAASFASNLLMNLFWETLEILLKTRVSIPLFGQFALIIDRYRLAIVVDGHHHRRRRRHHRRRRLHHRRYRLVAQQIA